MKRIYIPFFLIIFLLTFSNTAKAQVSYLGLDGGFEGTATIDNSTTYTAAQSGKWSKNNATTTLSNETTTVRSGNNSIKITNTSTSGRRVYSPLINVSTTNRVVLQYYRRVSNTTNCQQNQHGVMRNTTESLSGTYNNPSVADTWEKVTYEPTGTTNTNGKLWAVFLTRLTGTGGDVFIDDVCLYDATSVDNTAANAPGTLTVNNPTTSSLDLSWGAASGGVDGGGYMVVRYDSSPNTDNDPLVNGIYATGNTYTYGTGALTGTVVYFGTGTSFTNSGLSSSTTYYYKVYTFDKAYNYSSEVNGNGTTTSSGAPTVTIDNTGAPAAGNIVFNTTDVLISGFRLTPSASIDFTAVNVATSGSATTSDLGNFRLIHDADNSGTYNVGDALVATVASLANPLAFSGFTETFSAARRYLVIADVSAGATNGRTITASISAASNVTSTGSESGTATGNMQTIQAPEISVEGNATVISSGDVTPSAGDHTAFGTVEVGSTLIRTFTIKNIGNQPLSLSGSPIVAISGSGQFVVTAQPASNSINGPSGSLTFQVTYTPTTYTLQTATISIANNDGNGSESPYTFDINGTGSSSNLSIITTDSTYGYTPNIDYTDYPSVSITNSSQCVGVHNIVIRDGGWNGDNDALPTILNAITFTYTGTANTIATARLFTTLNAAVGTSVTAGANSITFTGLSGASVTAPDNGSIELILRVTFNTTVTDNEKLVFTVTSATEASSSTSSQFPAADAGGAISDNSGNDNNRIEVDATKLRFVQQPTTTSMNATMAPSVTVEATDNNNRRDKDYITNISIHSTGTMTSDPISVAAVEGLATFNSIVHTVDGTGFHLEASSGSFTTVNSTDFDITLFVYLSGDYRSAGDGTWLGTGSTSTWDRYGIPNPGWNLNVTRPATNTSNRVFIDHAINATSVSPDKVYIRDGGTLTIVTSCTVNDSLKVENGGTVQINANLTIGNSSGPEILEVDSGGTVIVNFEYGTPSSSLWKGTEIFHRESDLILEDWDCENDFLIPDNSAISTNTYAGYTAAFGNVILDFGTNLGSSDDWIMLASGVNINIAHGDLVFRTNAAANGADIRISTTGTVTSGVGGNFHVEDTYVGNVNINFKTSGTSVFTIKGDMILEGANVRGLPTAGQGSTSVINIEGDLDIGASAVFDFNSTIVGTGSPLPSATINLKGDLTVAGGGLLNNTNSNLNGILNFTGTGDGLTDSTTQTIDIASTSANENRYVNFFVKNGAYVKLINRDFELGTNDTLVVENGGVLDFGFNGTTPLLVKISGSQTGTGFRSLEGSTLKITSPDGITTTAGTGAGIGNVQTISSKRYYDQVATFHYIGKANQVTGNGITTGSSAKIIICELIDNNTQLSFTNSTGITSTTTISATGGKLDIRKGQVIESETAYISGSTGTLYMSPGTLYKVMKGYAVATTEGPGAGDTYIPRLLGTAFPYVLQGGTIELGGNTAGNYFQTLRGTTGGRPNYKYVKFSGTNNYDNTNKTATDYKNLSSTTSLDSALIITGNAIVDCINMAGVATSFDSTGGAGLVMDAGRLRLKKLNEAQPELIGRTIAYSLTGGTVEFYGSGATQQQQLRGNYRPASPLKISYYNIDINAAASNYDTSDNQAAGNVDINSSFLLKNVLTVNSPAVFRMDQDDFIDDAVSTTNSMVVNSGAGLLYGNQNGIKSSGTGVNDGNIRISGSRSLSTGASYGFVGPNNMVSGNGLPTSIASLFIYKSNPQTIVTLSNNLTTGTTDSLNFYHGIITTGGYVLSVSNGELSAIKGHDAPFTGTTPAVPAYSNDKYVIGNLERAIDITGIYSYPVGDVVNGEGYNPLRFSVTSGTGKATALFIPGDPGSCVVGPIFYSCNGIPESYNYTHMTTEGRWRMSSSTATTFNYDIYLHPNINNLNNYPNVTVYYITDVNGDTIGGGTNNFLDYRALKAPNGTTDWSLYASSGDRCVSSYYYNILGRGFSGFSDFAPAGGNTSTMEQLPVELTHFYSTCSEEGLIVLNWTTASELNSKHFVVEQSANGIDFAAITILPAAGNSNNIRHYSTIIPSASGRMYYRLAMVDLDNTLEYSRTILADCHGGFVNGLIIYYTPAEGIVIQSQTSESGKYLVQLFDAAGKLLLQETKYIGPGMNRYVLDVRKKLASGIYFIRAANDAAVFSQKLWIY